MVRVHLFRISLATQLCLTDFCLWGPPEPNSVVGDTEGEAVAYCTKPEHGTRLIPRGALQGVQFMKTPDYVQVVGFIDQTQINMQVDDWGGEMDPHGADLVRISSGLWNVQRNLCVIPSVEPPWEVCFTQRHGAVMEDSNRSSNGTSTLSSTL